MSLDIIGAQGLNGRFRRVARPRGAPLPLVDQVNGVPDCRSCRSAMNHRLAALMLVLLCLAGCHYPKPEDRQRVGRDGWLLYLEKPGEYLTAIREKQSFSVRARNTNSFSIAVTPRDLEFPVPPGAQYQEGSYQVIEQELVYTMPPGRTFQDVYEWYRAWFGFGGAASKR